jgi:hypothetical protein
MPSAHGTIDGYTGIRKKNSKPEKRFGRQPSIFDLISWRPRHHRL